MKQYTVQENEQNFRLDKIITVLDNTISRTAVKRLIEENKITVNGKVEKPSYEVKVGDLIQIEQDIPKESHLIAQDIPIDVIYEDDDILVINKPKGMVVHPGNGNADGTLANAVMGLCGDTLSGIGGEIRPGIIHRLDKDTSGVIVVAKNDNAHINISNQIKNRETSKKYIALVRGIIKEDEATINMPIGRSKTDRKKMAVRKDGKEAITHFKVLKRYDKYTLLELKIDTGRTHQIRVHMAEIGHPVIGDYIYSNGKNEFNVIGQMLHSKEIEFVHPTTKKRLEFVAPLPEYFKKILEDLDKTSSGTL